MWIDRESEHDETDAHGQGSWAEQSSTREVADGRQVKEGAHKFNKPWKIRQFKKTCQKIEL